MRRSLSQDWLTPVYKGSLKHLSVSAHSRENLQHLGSEFDPLWDFFLDSFFDLASASWIVFSLSASRSIRCCKEKKRKLGLHHRQFRADWMSSLRHGVSQSEATPKLAPACLGRQSPQSGMNLLRVDRSSPSGRMCTHTGVTRLS